MNPYGAVLSSTASFEFKHLVRSVRRLRYNVMEATEAFQEFADVAYKMRMAELTSLSYLLSERSSRMMRES